MSLLKIGTNKKKQSLREKVLGLLSNLKFKYRKDNLNLKKLFAYY